jgi:hypothetical protein
MTARLMYRWLDVAGRPVAEVLQDARMTIAGPRAVYIARVAGEQVEKERFTCARRVIEEWLTRNRVRASPVQA